MGNDPLYGDREKPPLLPMNNGEIIDFPIIRAITRMPTRRRRVALGAAVASSLILCLVAWYVGSTPARTASTASPRAEVTRVCTHLRADERAYSAGSITQQVFDDDLGTMEYTLPATAAVTARLADDLSNIGQALVNSDSPAGAALDDAHRLCAT